MADIMNKIKFLSDLVAPKINTDTLTVSGDLTVKGTTYTEHAADTIVKGAITVHNLDGDSAKVSLMGQVILTGNYRLDSGYCAFNDVIESVPATATELGISNFNLETAHFLSFSPEYVGLRYEDENPSDPTSVKKLWTKQQDSSTEVLAYDSSQGGWLDLSNSSTVQSRDAIIAPDSWFDKPSDGSQSLQSGDMLITIPSELIRWFELNVNEEVTAIVKTAEAYAIVYDPQSDAVRLGTGTYDVYTNGFTFNEGEGAPIAVRDLKTEDDGSLVMWDADRYCLVKSPIKYVSNEESDHIEIERAIHVGEGRSTLGGGTIELAGDLADGAQIKIYDENLNKHTSLNYSAIETGYGFFDRSITAHGHEDDEDRDVVHPAIDAQGDIVATGKITSHDAQVDNTMVIGEGVAEGISSIATGVGSQALGKASVAMGNQVKAESDYSHAEGDGSTASGVASHAEGYSYAGGDYSHAEGCPYNSIDTAASAPAAHAEGGGTQAKSDGAHTEGVNTVAGRLTQADATDTTKIAQVIAPAATKLELPFSTTEEIQAAVVKLGGFGAHAEGMMTQALGTGSHAEGNNNLAFANSTHVEGDSNKAYGEASHAEGWHTYAGGNQSHAEGAKTYAMGDESHAEGHDTNANGRASHSEGIETIAEGRAAHAEGEYTKATGNLSHAEGGGNEAAGYVSHAEGWSTYAGGDISHTEGYHTSTNAAGMYGHAEGNYTRVTGVAGHAEGRETTASGEAAHAEGGPYNDINTTAYAAASHAEGGGTQAKSDGAHTEGVNTVAGVSSAPKLAGDVHSVINSLLEIPEVKTSIAKRLSVSEDLLTTGYILGLDADKIESVIYEFAGFGSHAEGIQNKAYATGSHAEGLENVVSGHVGHAEGKNNVVSGYNGHAEGFHNTVSGQASHVEGYESTASGYVSHAEGYKTEASGKISHSEGSYTKATGECAHAEGRYTNAIGLYSHAEGSGTTQNLTGKTADQILQMFESKTWLSAAVGQNSHVEGTQNLAYGQQAHAENSRNLAKGNHSHAEGMYTKALGEYSHTEGFETVARGNQSHAGGLRTIASADAQTVIGSYNKENTNALFIVGNGSSVENRSNAFEVLRDGSIKIGNTKLTEANLQKILDLVASTELTD